MKQRVIFSFTRDTNDESQNALLEAYEDKEKPYTRVFHSTGTELLECKVFIERIFHWSNGNSTVVFNMVGTYEWR